MPLREILTFLAGLVVMLLLAALIGPAFVDWSALRGVAQERLSAAIGVPVTIAGRMDVRLLPVPRLQLSEARFGDLPGSHATIADLTFELAPADLLRGRIRITDASADGVALTLAGDGAGGLQLPALPPTAIALDHVRISRSVVHLTGAGHSGRTIGPVALEMTAPHLAGPWRVEGEIEGWSLRLVTGESEANGRTRARLSLNGYFGQAVLDGTFVPQWREHSLVPGFDGSVSASLSEESADLDQPAAPMTLTGKLSVAASIADFSQVTMLLGESAGRLEGAGRLDLTGTGPSNLAFRARRIDPILAIAALKPGLLAPVRQVGLPPIALSVDVDQMTLRGEETGETSLRGWLGAGGLNDATLSTSLAGARLGFTGHVSGLEAVAGAITVTVPETRRFALALNRMGLDGALADGISGLGTAELQTIGTLEGQKIAVSRAIFITGGGSAEASGTADGASLTGRVAIDGLDPSRVPPLGALAAFRPGAEVALEIALTRLRLGAGPVGEAQLALRRVGGVWQPGPFSARGFGGLSLTGQGDDGGKGLSGEVTAPQADVVLALAGPFLPASLRSRLAAAAPSLSPLALRYALTPAGDTALAFTAAGTAGRTRLQLVAERASRGQFQGIDLSLDLPDRALLFQGLGLPRPGLDGPARLTVRQTGPQARVETRLTGEQLDLLIMQTGDGDIQVTASAARPDLLLPSAFVPLLPEGRMLASAQFVPGEDDATLDRLAVTIGTVKATGRLSLSPAGAITGALDLPRLSLPDLGGLLLRTPSPPSQARDWTGTRFSASSALPSFALRVTAPLLGLGAGYDLTDARFDLSVLPDSIGLSRIAGRLYGGEASGTLTIRRDGGLASLSGRLTADRVDAARLSGGEATGHLSGQIDFGASGESPARLVAGLGGSGTLRLTGGAITRLDPAALSRVVAGTGDSATDADRQRLAERTQQALSAGAWPVETLTVPLTIAGGVARLQPTTQDAGGTRVELAGTADLRTLTVDVRATLTMLAAPPTGWSGPAPHVTLHWRGTGTPPQRQVDAASLSNAFAARALAREIERVEAFEADIRERSFFARRLRAEREIRDAEARAAEAARLADIQRFLDDQKRVDEERRQSPQTPDAGAVVPRLPPPVELRVIPAPFSRAPPAN